MKGMNGSARGAGDTGVRAGARRVAAGRKVFRLVELGVAPVVGMSPGIARNAD